MLGFHLIEDLNHIYRVEYGKDQSGNYTVLKAVLRFCKYPDSTDRCPDGEPVEDMEPEPKKPINTTTRFFLEARPKTAVSLSRRDKWSMTTSQDITGLPDIHFPTPILTGHSAPSLEMAPILSSLADSELKIDLGKLNAAGLIDIMLGATNIDEVKHARLSLKVSTDCFTNQDGKVECQKVVVGMEGHRLTNDTFLMKSTGTTISTQSVVNSASLPTTMLEGLYRPPPRMGSSLPPPPRFEDGVQVVLGPMLRGQDHTDASALIPDNGSSKDQAQANYGYVGLLQRSPSLKMNNEESPTQILTPTVTYVPVDEQDLTEGENRPSPAAVFNVRCGLMGCPWQTNDPARSAPH